MSDAQAQRRVAGFLVSTDWLAAHQFDPDLRIFDCTVILKPDPPRVYRIESGRPHYQREHIPGAGFLDLIEEFSDPASDLNFTLPAPSRFAEAMSAHGVGAGRSVVLYSSAGPAWATRMWWMLKAFGFDDVAVLDGGLGKWKREGRAIDDAPCAYPRERFEAAPRAGWFVDKRTVAASLHDADCMTINALRPEMHRGEAPVDYGRPGRIPGSRNLYYEELLTGEDAVFKPAAELRRAFAELGALDAGRVTVYCGAGISATADAFALRLLGRENVSVYDGSMSEWGRDPELPMESG